MSPEAKKKLLAKCNGHCAYCGRMLSLGTLTIDHFVPLSKGGSNIFSNLLPSCRACNVAKGNKDLETFRKAVKAKMFFFEKQNKVSDALQALKKKIAQAEEKARLAQEEYQEAKKSASKARKTAQKKKELLRQGNGDMKKLEQVARSAEGSAKKFENLARDAQSKASQAVNSLNKLKAELKEQA